MGLGGNYIGPDLNLCLNYNYTEICCIQYLKIGQTKKIIKYVLNTFDVFQCQPKSSCNVGYFELG